MKSYDDSVTEQSIAEIYGDIAKVCNWHASGEVLCALGMAIGVIFRQMPKGPRDRLFKEWTAQLREAIERKD